MSPDLAGRVVALSTSPSNDLGRLGFPRAEYDRILFDLSARCVRAGGRLLYGGHLREGSVTAQIYEYVAKAYGTGPGVRREKPLVHLLSQSEFRRASFAHLHEMQVNFGAFVETRVIVDDDRHLVLGRRATALLARERGGAAKAILDDASFRRFADALPALDEPTALTAMRRVASHLVAARVVIGGKRGDLGAANEADRFAGVMPGIYEETLTALAEGKPTVILGTYGGAARDVAIDLGLIGNNWETPYLGAIQSGYDAARARMRALSASLPLADVAKLRDFALREDSEALAREVIAWIAVKLKSVADPPGGAGLPA